ncbi:Senecionine N-oxygenase [Coemansia sp. S610]|uniref:glutaminase n=2 Tax=Coemansia TaxID=4863 RepID=A0A9W8L752_9FUNG|nr:Senecionine N-oxygenase [Coemansia sp. RSA 2675]KAJ2025566.1 Senecionine N-oxygenase [Coemansia sp. S85]KAJ2030852.1 Senecionine N-oxygenase [Coemansia sp. S610]KAJ2383048.1 Senecionine N-oxygenase [Coemansia sp. RSA 2611]KAJ2414462.1 Senecionine N-oxygenase [Coemansia sp. RSA 2530]KAJ2690410.1 Senecionine N-oxygenase [Coemansia spiralis]KAJ2702617.1 Senecionine N-oxygenase [Coemansia sp. IMI 209128]KAJ2772327.1 Senecionine N-oxygenase [Coemansia linderi]
MAKTLTIGVLALQGAFIEHIHALNTLRSSEHISDVVEVRTKQELDLVDALIIPGGESTSIALIAERCGILEDLREFARTKPTWGTCAGLILLAKTAIHTKKGGQQLLNALPVTVSRNQFGRQVDSFSIKLSSPCLEHVSEQSATGAVEPFEYVFIRAPAIVSLDDSEVEPLVKLPPGHGQTEASEDGLLVAVRYRKMLGTSFHPELTNDTRWHRYFVRMALAQE